MENKKEKRSRNKKKKQNINNLNNFQNNIETKNNTEINIPNNNNPNAKDFSKKIKNYHLKSNTIQVICFISILIITTTFIIFKKVK